MSHVDEGLLHALLDGGLDGTTEFAEVQEHLSRCEACRQRLEEARTLHERAAAILGGAPAGDVPTPPFADILERKRRETGPPPALRIRRFATLGWAATIALAVGIGWLARDSLAPGGQPLDRSASPGTAVRAPAGPMSGSRADDADASTADAPAPSTVATGERTVTRQEAMVEPVAVPAAPPPAEAPAAVGGRGVEAEKATLTADVVAGLGEGERAGQDPPRPPEEERMLAPAAARVAPSEPALREQVRPAARRADDETGLSATPVRVGTDWQPSDVGAAAALLGRPLAAVAGLPVLHVETGTVGGAPAVRVTQEIDDDSVTVTQYGMADTEAPAAGADLSDAPALHAVQLRRDGFIVILEGPVSRDSLLRLADRIP